MLHYTKTPCTKYTDEEKIRYAKKDFAEAHDRYEIIYLITGNVCYHVDGIGYSLKHGDVLIIPPGKIHKRTIVPEEDYERYNIQFHRELLSSNATHVNNIIDSLLNVGSEHILYFPAEIVKKYSLDKKIQNFKKFQNYENNKDIILISYILNLAIEINNIILNDDLVQKVDFLDIEHQMPVLREIVNYVDQNLCSKIQLDDIANALYMNKYYLSHYFKEKMGISIKQYVTMKKLFHADFLINNGNSPTAVALDLGYSNYSTFYSAYKKYFNREPSKLRPYMENSNKK